MDSSTANSNNDVNKTNKQYYAVNNGAIKTDGYDTLNSDPFASFGNIVVDDGKWIIGKETTPEQFSSTTKATVEKMVDSVFVKLREKFPLTDTSDSKIEANPFANGNNPFGNSNVAATNYLQSQGKSNPLPTAGVPDFLTSTQGKSLTSTTDKQVTSGSNPISGSSNNPFTGAGTNNPFASGSNQISGSSNNPFSSTAKDSNSGGSTTQSFDFLKVIFGDSVPSLNNSSNSSSNTNKTTTSNTEVLKNVENHLINLTATINSPAGNQLFNGGNNTPLQSPSDLLNLFKSDIVSFNIPANSVSQVAGGNNPFTTLFAGSGNDSQVKPPVDLLKVVLNGLLPFDGSDNIFQDSDGKLPIGHGNNDFGKNNASIGNANWNYGNHNASIGNANWNWDSSKNNATIGNGNWNLDSSHDNRTIGNGNWDWESTNHNKTLGNGNWNIGSNNTTLGNGNWDFGSNNTVIGTGNWVFTNNSLVIGNGNWSVIVDKSAANSGNFLSKLENLVFSLGIKYTADHLIDSVMSRMGEAFMPLTGSLSKTGMESYNNLIVSHGNHSF